MEAVVQRCAGIDIGKATLKATVRVQGGARRKTRRKTRREVRTFQTTTPDLLALRDWLADEQVTLVGMESTGVFGSRSTTCSRTPWSAGCSTPST
jgi:transposase